MMSPYDAGFLFVFKAWRRAHSWDYVTEAATPKAGKKTSKMGILFASKSPVTREDSSSHFRANKSMKAD